MSSASTFGGDDVDIVLSDPPNLSTELYDQWLSGKHFSTWTTAHLEPVPVLKSRYPNFVGAYATERTSESQLFNVEKADANRLFNHLEHYFSIPSVTEPQLIIWFQIPRSMRLKLIEKYYGYDNLVMREIISKRLTKSRRDAEEIADATRYHKGSVTRQVENVKRMYALVFDESKQFQGNLVKSIETIFLLPVALCRRYASVLFLIYSKFDLKKVQSLPCSALERCSSVIMVRSLILIPCCHCYSFVISL